MAQRLTDRAEQSDVELRVQCDGGELVGDQRALSEALFNLIANAVEATPAGGDVCVETRATEDGDHHWTIRDRGRGIPAERIAQLGRRVATTKVGGTELGVALAQEVVSRHGGLMRVESAVGGGTTVSIWLPSSHARNGIL